MTLSLCFSASSWKCYIFSMPSWDSFLSLSSQLELTETPSSGLHLDTHPLPPLTQNLIKASFGYYKQLVLNTIKKISTLDFQWWQLLPGHEQMTGKSLISKVTLSSFISFYPHLSWVALIYEHLSLKRPSILTTSYHRVVKLLYYMMQRLIQFLITLLLISSSPGLMLYAYFLYFNMIIPVLKTKIIKTWFVKDRV